MAETDEEIPNELPIGERLRQGREAKGISLDEVAGQTRIPVRHLQHIETGDWDALPAATYSIGFVRAYGNAVGMDGAALGRELREQIGGEPRRAGPMPEYFEPADPARVPPRWLAFAALLIAVLLIGGYLLFRSGIDEGGDVAAGEQKAPAAAPVPQEAQPAPAASAAGQPVVLTAQAPVWMRVSDGGRTVVERTLAAGEAYQVPTELREPTLRVGAPESLRITVGQTVVPQLGPSGQPIGNVSLRPESLAARAAGAASPQPGQPPAQ